MTKNYFDLQFYQSKNYILEKRLLITMLAFVACLAGFMAHAEIPGNGVDSETYIISDDLAVVDKNDATGQYFV